MLATARPARPIGVYLKLNTGMNRLGFIGDEVESVHASGSCGARLRVSTFCR